MFEVGQRVKTTENSKVQKDFGIDRDSQLIGTVKALDADDEEFPYKIKFDNNDANDDADGTWVNSDEVEPLEESEDVTQ